MQTSRGKLGSDRIIELALELLNTLMADNVSRQLYAKEIQALFRLIMPQHLDIKVVTPPKQELNKEVI